jgi:hypothetical protein
LKVGFLSLETCGTWSTALSQFRAVARHKVLFQ